MESTRGAGASGRCGDRGGWTAREFRVGLNDRLNLAIVGCGGQGAENLKQVSAQNIIALCDVDEERGAEACKQFPRAKRFRDYRKLLDAMHGQIDAVVISIPDHMHAPVSLAAMDLGKHVYCEKPLCMTLEEADEMIDVCRRQGVLLMYAEELFFTPKYVQAKRMADEGAFGRYTLCPIDLV